MLNDSLKKDFDDAFITDLLKSYVKGGQESLDNMQSDIQRKDYQSISFWAHKLKGSSRMIGAKEIEALSSSIEQRASNEDILLRDEIKDLGSEFAKLIVYIREEY